jgi:plastocyanin
MTGRMLTRRAKLTVVPLVAALALAACSSDKKSTTSGATTTSGASGASTVTMRAGLNDPKDKSIAVLMYLPQSITVDTGTTVEWDTAGPEPHSVTFMPPGQQLPAPGSDESLFAPTPAANGVYDGKSLVNSGLVPQGPAAAPPFRLRFDTPGAYQFACVIHAQMKGTVNVVAKGGKADTQAEVTSRGDSELAGWLSEGEAAKAKLESAAPAKKTNSDGTTTWTVQTGTSTAHTDVLAFSPVSAAIKPRDQVVFLNDSAAPHTASFPGTKAVPQDPTSKEATTAAPGPSPLTLNATDFFNTGTLPPNAPPGSGPPVQARSFTFVVPAAGQYAYVCIYHAPSGMAGTITAA